MISREQLKQFDIWMVLLITILVGIGIVAISSAQHVNFNADPYYVKRQILWFVIGLVLMLVVAFLDYRTLGDFYWIAYLMNIGLLLAVLIFGREAKGAVRWLQVGFIRIQPSEFAKIIMIFCIAKFIDKKKEKVSEPFTLLSIIIFMVMPIVLILRQPDLSTSIVFFVILTSALFVGKIDYRYILGAFLIGVPVAAGLFFYVQNPNQKLLKDYQRDRIMAVIQKDENSDERFQTRQSVHAIGSGQLYGKGLYKGTLNQLSYLPEPHTDFIFSVIGEEFGFIGCISVLGLILLIILRGMWIAKDVSDLFGKLIISGVMTMIAFQTFVNIGVVTDLLPNTGIPLPFVSYGGSSLWANMIGIGLVLNVGMRRQNHFFRRGF